MHMPGAHATAGGPWKGEPWPARPGDFLKSPQLKPAYGACYITPMLLPLTTGCSAPPGPVSPQKSFSCSCFPIPLKLMRLLTILLHFH
jgi:hypothetical protein